MTDETPRDVPSIVALVVGRAGSRTLGPCETCEQKEPGAGLDRQGDSICLACITRMAEVGRIA
jgi:hypothetical protein